MKKILENIETLIKEYWESIKILIKKVTIAKDFFLVLEKVIFGIISHSSFLWINALYSAFLGSARTLCVKNLKTDYKEQYNAYVKVAILLILSSIVYTAYNSYSMFNGKTTSYHLYISIGIAAFTFFEFGLSIKELIKVRKKKDPIAKSLAYISFSSILSSFVLTQNVLTALHPEENHSIGNGVSAIVFGGIMLLTAVIMLVRKNNLKENNLEQEENKE